ncbi:hypothetical protein LCGC14_2105420, partial [marine sediment metagenome]
LNTYASAIQTNLSSAFSSVLSLAADVRNVISGQVALESSELTISAGGAITPTRSHHTVDTASDDATDNLDEMAVSGTSEGGLVLLRPEHTDRIIVCRHNEGGTTNPLINASADAFSMISTEHYICYQRVGTQWIEVFRSELFPAAGQAAVETGTSIIRAVTPGVQQFHESAAKAWLIFDGTVVDGVTDLAGVNAEYNVSSVIDQAPGEYVINWDTDFSSANYAVAAMGKNATGAGDTRIVMFDDDVAPTASALRLAVDNHASARNDSELVGIVAYGDQ